MTADSANYTVSKEVVSLSGTPLDMLRAAATAMGMKFQPSKGFMEAALAQMKKKNNSWAGAPINMLTAWEAVKKIVAMLDLRMWTGPDPDDPGGSTNRLWVGTEREISLGVIYKMQHSGEPAPARPTFRVRGVIDLATSTFPCLTWAPEGGSASATWLAGGEDHAGKGVLLSYIDNDTGKVVEVQVLPQAQEVATVGPIAAAQQDLKAKDAGGGELTGDSVKSDGTPAVHMSAPMPAGEIGRLRAQQEANRCQAIGNPAQKGVISSIGLPWVVPPMLVNLAGAGDIYDGPYRVEKATHTWTGGTYDLSLTCMRLGAGIDPEGEKLQTPAGAVPE